MAAAEVFGAEPAWLADLDPAAAALLAHRYPGVPNLGDITAVDWDLVALLAPVELVFAGWPCQPFSLAGKQKGADDDRALWPEVDRCLRALRPQYVLLENVPAVVAAGELERVATSLASLGYRFAWCCLTAAAVGAPHKRDRFFLVAVAEDADGAARGQRGIAASDQAESRRTRADAGRRGRASAADADSDAVREQPIAKPRGLRTAVAEQPRINAAPHAEGRGLAGDTERDSETQLHQADDEPRLDADGRVLDWAGYEPAIRRWEAVLGRPAPVPTVPGARGGRVLNPELPEWMMGLPAGWITGVPGLSRAQQLKLAGNGVVWQQAVEAYLYLLGVLDADARSAA
ncbi:DNA cytosine methyltransferase [Amycolatopsis sp. FU40]|uniref:DNA cytosine methyltransferase n=1 Tax=Amycolatopsis sp. FU40 TaxID=2914159 RepID=UPI001EFF66D0|nr:DNA cytosine methyltransferase [Amycolatopsis sp. FU40]UKD55123.1 DNA cytosine methyltransferase [Amycolatopsis sp. FU40]